MRIFKERWYLYSDDVDLAREFLEKDLASASTTAERAWLLKYLPRLGLIDQAQVWLEERDTSLLNEVDGKGTYLRILQKQNDCNPWRAMVPTDRLQELAELCNVIFERDEPFDSWLGGGLGDYLNFLGCFCDSQLAQFWGRAHLIIPYSGKIALDPFLKLFWPSWAPSYSFYSGLPPRSDRPYWFSQMGWSFFQQRFELYPQPQVFQTKSPPETSSPSLVFCWRSKVEPTDLHWSYLRSLNFVQITTIYSYLMPWARSKKLSLIDLTHYRPEEQSCLQKNYPDLRLEANKINSFVDTMNLVLDSRGVVTVDTSLVHLAGWLGWPTLLLLHYCPDERWSTRPTGWHQSHPLKVIHQLTYNYWEASLEQLLSCVSNWPWL